jgi:hypothetical protein
MGRHATTGTSHRECPQCQHRMRLMQVQHTKPKIAAPTTRWRYACLGDCGHTLTVVEPAHV